MTQEPTYPPTTKYLYLDPATGASSFIDEADVNLATALYLPAVDACGEGNRRFLLTEDLFDDPLDVFDVLKWKGRMITFDSVEAALLASGQLADHGDSRLLVILDLEEIKEAQWRHRIALQYADDNTRDEVSRSIIDA